MELALAVLVHQQFANNIQLLLLVPQEKKPWRLNPTRAQMSENIRAELYLVGQYVSRIVPCWPDCKAFLGNLAAVLLLEYTVILPKTQRLRAIRQYLVLLNDALSTSNNVCSHL